MSVVAWLDSHADDLARARDFIKALQKAGVLDEGGFLTLPTRYDPRALKSEQANRVVLHANAWLLR